MADPRALSKMVLAPEWRLSKALETVEAGEIDAAIAEIEAAVPLSKMEPQLNGPMSGALANAIRPIGALIAPGMNEGQADAFRAALVLALADLPPNCALYGLKKALHVPMEFPNQVHGVARGFADEAVKKQQTALHRLKMMRAEIERALNPQPKLEAPPMIWTEESIAEANAIFEKTGLATRYRLGANGEADTYQLTADEHEAERQERLKTAEFDAEENKADNGGSQVGDCEDV